MKRLVLVGVSRPIEDTFLRTRADIPDGHYSPDELVAHLKDGWVSYFECHKCGWFETCRFPQRHAANPNRARDIQCGVALQAMKNFLLAWWRRLHQMTPIQKTRFFDALFYFTQYVLDAHLGIGQLFDNMDVSWWGERMAIGLSTNPLSSRSVLDDFAAALHDLPVRLFTLQRFLFVEGEAEEVFIRHLIDRREFRNLSVHSLAGKGNAKPSRLPLTLLRRKGYRVLVQIDRDAAHKDKVRELVSQVEASGGAVFQFSRDFEDAFPSPFIRAALGQLKVQVDDAWLDARRKKATRGPLIKQLEDKCGVRIPKRELAAALAELVDSNLAALHRRWPQSEIARWLKWIRNGGPSRRRRVAGHQG